MRRRLGPGLTTSGLALHARPPPCSSKFPDPCPPALPHDREQARRGSLILSPDLAALSRPLPSAVGWTDDFFDGGGRASQPALPRTTREPPALLSFHP